MSIKRYKCKSQPRDTLAIDVRTDIVCFDMHTSLGHQQIVLTKHKAKQLSKFLNKELANE